MAINLMLHLSIASKLTLEEMEVALVETVMVLVGVVQALRMNLPTRVETPLPISLPKLLKLY
jgi:hypothetical protein